MPKFQKGHGHAVGKNISEYMNLYLYVNTFIIDYKFLALHFTKVL